MCKRGVEAALCQRKVSLAFWFEVLSSKMESAKKWELSSDFVGQKLVGEPITEFKVSKGSNVGDNVAGELVSIRVTTKKGQVISLVFKSFPDDPAQLNYASTNKIFRIETAIYKSVVPSLGKILVKFGQASVLPVPKFFAAHNDDLNDYLCLEDLRPAGFKMLDKHAGLGKLETSLVLQELARFHALTYYLIRYEGEKYFEGEGEVGMLSKNIWTNNMIDWEVVNKLFGGSCTVGLEFLTDADPELAGKVRKTFGNVEDAGKIFKSTTLKTDKKYFPCILHGDLWTNNILFKHIDGVPTEVKFVDFQQSRRGNIFEDLQYFLLTSTTPKDRRVFLNDWLAAYYESFTKTLEIVQCPAPLNFDQNFFTGEMWNCFLSGYAYMHFAIPFQLGIFTPLEGEAEEAIREPPNGPHSIDTIADGLHAKFRKWMERSPAAKDRLLEITREFVEYGLI